MNSAQAARLTWARRTAATLHRAHCNSLWWSEECRRDDGGSHARNTWLPDVKHALNHPDPIAALHDQTCHAMLDTAARGCPLRADHIALYRETLGDPPAAADASRKE